MACSELRVLDDASLGASEVKNGSHRHLPGLSVRDHRLDKTPWQLVTSRKSISREALNTAVNLTNDCFLSSRNLLLLLSS